MITQKYLKTILDYNSETGIWTWLVPRGNVKKGRIAGRINREGYRIVKIHRKGYLSSRLAFFYMNGQWPKLQMDHKNRIKNDDRWENLREVTCKENIKNRNNRVKKQNNGFPIGVRKRGKKYISETTINCKKIHIGTFKTMEQAEQAYILYVKFI